MKATFAPLATKKEPATLSYSRESIYDSGLTAKYDYFRKKGIPGIPKVVQRKTAYTRANELPFVKFQPSTQYMSKFLVTDDDSGDRKGEKIQESYEQKRIAILNTIYSAKLQREIALMNQEYMEWKSYYSEDGPSIRWTGEVSYYGSYILFNIALKFTPQFFTAIFFKSGMYKTVGGRFFITQFLEQVLNIRLIEPYYKLLNDLAAIEPNDLEGNDKYQAFLAKMTPGGASIFPMIQGSLAIAQSFFRKEKITFSRFFMKNLPTLLASPTINYYTAIFTVNLFGASVPIMVSQLAAAVFVQFISGQVTNLTKVYFFADIAKLEEEEQRRLAREANEKERKDELALRRKYVEIGIVGKDIDERIKMKFDWEGNFGKNIAKFQDGLYKAWKTRGDAMPIFGSVGLTALLGVWGTSSIFGFIMFSSTNNFAEYQLATGENIGWRFFFDFLTNMLRTFKFFDGMFSVETLALPVVQKLRNDLIRVFTELATDIFSDMRKSVSKVLSKAYYSGGSFDNVNRLQKQSAFAYYFYTAMEKILDIVSNISDPAFKLILENYLNLNVPLSQTIVTNMFRFSIENSLQLFESMNLFFLQFGVLPMTTSQGQISFYDTVLRQSTKGRYSNPAQMLYKIKTDQYSLLKPGTILGNLFGFFSIQIPTSFAGYEENMALLPLPHRRGEKVIFLDMNLNKLPPPQRAALIKMWNQIGVFQKIPAIFNFFLQGVSTDDLKDPLKMDSLFTSKMDEPETKRLFDALQIPPESRNLITSQMFVQFAGQYESFLQNALNILNEERSEHKPAYTLEDIKGARLDRTTMSRFSDLFADEYSLYVTTLVYQNVPLFSSFEGSFRHSYSFMEGADVRYHNFVLQREGEPPEGYRAYTLDELDTDILTPSFFKRKMRVKKPGKIDSQGVFVSDPTSSELHDVEVELEVPESSVQRVYSSFEMLSRMGYTIYYKKDKRGIDGDATKDSTVDNVSKHFEGFFTDMVRESLGGGKLGDWRVGFFEEGPYLDGSNTFYSAETNVLQVGENTHFFYNWTKHNGVRNLVYPPDYGEVESEKSLRIAFNNGLLHGEYLDRYLELAAARSFNTAAGERVAENRASELYRLDREYERLGLRTMHETHMFELFRGALQPNGDPTMLSGNNPGNLTMGTIFQNMMRHIMGNNDIFGMFPDVMVPIYGSNGQGESGPEVGTYESASREGSWFFSQKYQSVYDFYQDPDNRIRLQRMLAYTIHGWFSKKDGTPAMYKATLTDTTPSVKPRKTPADLSVLGPEKNPDSLDFNAYRKKIRTSTDGKGLDELQVGGLEQDDFVTFMKFLYLITDDEGKISVPAYQTHFDALTEPIGEQVEEEGKEEPEKKERARIPRSRAFQIEYIDEQLGLLVNAGKKRPNFIQNCMLDRTKCYTYQTPRESLMAKGVHYLFQIDYYLHGLNIADRVAQGKGIQNHEIYDGFSPYFQSIIYSNIGRFYFGSNSFMGLSHTVLDSLFEGSDKNDSYKAWKKKVKNLQRNKILEMLEIRSDDQLADSVVLEFTSFFDTEPKPGQTIAEFLDEQFNSLPGSSALRFLFGTPEKKNKFLKDLQSGEMLGYFTSGGAFDEIRGLIVARMRQIQNQESAEVNSIEDRRGEVLERYHDMEEAVNNQRNDIVNQLNLLWNNYNNNTGTANIPPLRPIESYRTPPPPPADEPAAAPLRAEGPEEVPNQGQRVKQRPVPAMREELIGNQLASAEKQANIERLRNELSQSQTQAQREDIRLRLMNAYIEIFGGDTSYFASLSDAELSDFINNTGLFPDRVTLEGPKPEPFKKVDVPLFEQCATRSDKYILRGASGVSITGVPATEQNQDMLQPFLECRSQALLVGSTKTAVKKLFDFSGILGDAATKAGCPIITTFGGIVLGGIAGGLSGIFGGPVGIAVGAKAGAVAGAKAGLYLSSLCIPATNLIIQYVLPNYIQNRIISSSSLLQELQRPGNESSEAKVRIFEEHFNRYQRELADPNITPVRVNEIRQEMELLFAFLLFESHYAGDNPEGFAFTFSSTLFGTEKSSYFNTNPFFKPSADQITFLNSLGIFDFSNVNKIEDLLEAIRGAKLNVNDATLTVLFGEKYVKPAGMPIDFNPAYNVWYRIGETIRALDNYDTRTASPGQRPSDGNLFQVMTSAIRSILDFKQDKYKDVSNAVGEINRYSEEQEEAEGRRRAEGIREKPREYEVTSFFNHIFGLAENINISNTELKDRTNYIQRMPMLIENNEGRGTFYGYGIATDVTSANGISGPLDVEAIGGTDNNSNWLDIKATPIDDRKKIRNLFAANIPGYGIPYYNKKWTILGFPFSSRQDYRDIYGQMYQVLDNVPSDEQIQHFFKPLPKKKIVQTAFMPGVFEEHPSVTFYDVKSEAWVEGEPPRRGYERPESLNMETHGNFPPFLFMTKEEWEDTPEKATNEALLKKYYVRQSTTITFPDGTTKEVYGWFLQTDIDAFAIMQQPSDSSYKQISLIDAVLNNTKFKVKGRTEPISLFLENNDLPLATDSPEEQKRKFKIKYMKSLLIRFIFSTTNNSFREYIEFSTYEDATTGISTPTIKLFTVYKGKKIGVEVPKKEFSGEIQGVENVRLRTLARERQKRKSEGKEVLTDLNGNTQRELNLFVEKLNENPEIFTDINEPERDAATQLLNGILYFKLGGYYNSKKEEEDIDVNKREVFRTNAPTLTSLGNQSIAAARAALGDNFQTIYNSLLENIGRFANTLVEPKDSAFKEILLVAIPPLSGGGKEEIRLANEKWNELIEPSGIDNYRVIQISVKQPAVYYPDDFLVKYISHLSIPHKD